jgi:hypothetical protein
MKEIRYCFMEKQFLCKYITISPNVYYPLHIWEMPLLGLPIDARKIDNEIELIIHQRIIQCLLEAQTFYSIEEICEILDNNPKISKSFIGRIYSDDKTGQITLDEILDSDSDSDD